MDASFSENSATVLSLTPKPEKKHRMAMCDNQPRCKAIRPLGSLLRCGGCNSVFYCDAKCQKQAWKTGGHSTKCEAMAAKYRRKLEKKKKQVKKLRQAKKEAEASNQSFNASLSIMFMDSDSSDEESSSVTGTEHLESSRLSISEKDTSLNRSDGSFNIAGLSLEPEKP